MSLIKKRESESHKGENGRVLVIGGSKDYVGAPALAGMAALRTGVDIVVIASPEKTAWVINGYSPDLITRKIKGDFFNWDNAREIVEMAEHFDVVAIGNGLGVEAGTMDFAREVVERISGLKVVDADALKALRGADFYNAILTPHAKEFEIMTGERLSGDVEEKAKIVQSCVKGNNVILLKGHVDIIADKKTLKFNKTGNPGMTVGGTGDVLAGICAGLLAQSKNLFESAYAAAYLNGAVGDYLFRKKKYGFTASDMINEICEIKRKTRWI